MTHADTLRGMASDERILAGRENPRSTALLAGADALDAVDRVREAVERIGQLEDAAWDTWRRDTNMYEQGRPIAYGHALIIIIDALEGDTE